MHTRIVGLQDCKYPIAVSCRRLARLNELRHVKPPVKIIEINAGPTCRKFYGQIPAPLELSAEDIALLCSGDDLMHGADVYSGDNSFICMVARLV